MNPTSIVEDFDHIRVALEQIEREKASIVTTSMPTVQPDYAPSELPWGHQAPDFDPA